MTPSFGSMCADPNFTKNIREGANRLCLVWRTQRKPRNLQTGPVWQNRSGICVGSGSHGVEKWPKWCDCGLKKTPQALIKIIESFQKCPLIRIIWPPLLAQCAETQFFTKNICEVAYRLWWRTQASKPTDSWLELWGYPGAKGRRQ